MIRARLSVLAASILVLAAAASAAAQTPGNAARRSTVFIPGLLTGPGSFGPIGFRRLCDLRVTGLVEWRVSWIVRVIGLDSAQRNALADLQAASAKAKRTVAAACPPGRPQTSVAELDMMGKRLAAITQAFGTVKPAYEAFYAGLDRRQKAKIDGLGPHRHGWRW